jgi:hypothetical protein
VIFFKTLCGLKKEFVSINFLNLGGGRGTYCPGYFWGPKRIWVDWWVWDPAQVPLTQLALSISNRWAVWKNRGASFSICRTRREKTEELLKYVLGLENMKKTCFVGGGVLGPRNRGFGPPPYQRQISCCFGPKEDSSWRTFPPQNGFSGGISGFFNFRRKTPFFEVLVKIHFFHFFCSKLIFSLRGES